DKNAPNGRVVLIDPKNPDEKNWKDVLPERSEPLQGVGTAGGKLFASWRKDVATRAYVFSLDGKLENEIVLPGLGTAGGFILEFAVKTKDIGSGGHIFAPRGKQ